MQTWIYLVALLGAFYQHGVFSQDESCFDDENACTQNLRELLVSDDEFWFGSNYDRMCQSSAVLCRQTDEQARYQSIFARVYQETNRNVLQNRVNNVNLVHVSFNAPEGRYYACGNHFNVDKVDNVRIDPTKVMRLSLWSTTNKPTLSWTPNSDSDYHTVVMYDSGFHWGHAMYINCQGGNWDSCDAVIPYNGPAYPFPYQNVYTILVFQQRQRLDLSTVQQEFQQVTANTVPNFYLNSYLSQYGNQNLVSTTPTHANLLRVLGDPYAVEAQLEQFAVNLCPLYVSQLPAFHRVMQATSLPVQWSNPEFTSTLYSTSPYVTTLSADIHLIYMTEDFSVESCCEDYEITYGGFNVNPFSTQAIRAGNMRDKPTIFLSPVVIMGGGRASISTSSYTLMMVHVSPALEYDSNDSKLFIHWMVTNIQNADMNTGDEVIQYFGPTPTEATRHNTYMFFLFKQRDAFVDNAVVGRHCDRNILCETRITPLANELNLVELSAVSWLKARQDGYARYVMYNGLSMTEHEVCRNVPGYASPCPSKQDRPGDYCPTTDSAPRQMSSFAPLLTIFVVIMAVMRRFFL